MLVWLDGVPWGLAILACLTLGLAPFTPPHLVEKLGMLRAGELTRPLDIVDLLFHAAPWGLLVLKIVRSLTAGEVAVE